jgi:hypothetical protein
MDIVLYLLALAFFLVLAVKIVIVGLEFLYENAFTIAFILFLLVIFI